MDVVNESGNGRGTITFDDLADPSRFQFRRDTLDLSDWVSGVKLHLKTLSVGEREALPDMSDAAGKTDASTPKLAAIFAAVVEDVEVDGKSLGKPTAEQATAFLGKWPGQALDTVIEKFGELTGNEEEKSAAASTFPAD